MPMSRAKKEQEVAFYKQRFTNDGLVVVTHYTGLTVAQMRDLRKRLYANDASYKVTKNTLARIAAKDTDYETISDLFEGPTGIATSPDPVSAAKIVHEFAKEHGALQILGGAMGQQRLSPDEIEKLAKMPSLDELRSKIVGVIQAPAQKMAGVMQATPVKVARVCKAYGDTGQ
jgi:large subunit ribosomal protein L10